jgi:hypothetical protein
MDDEISREQLEEQLMAGVTEEAQPETIQDEVVPKDVVETPQEEVQAASSLEELQTRLAEMEDQLRQKSGALSEERDRRRVSEGQYAQVMDYIQEARQRQAQAQSQQSQPMDDDEYADYLRAWEQRYGPQVGQVVERLNNLETMLAQKQQVQQQAQVFASQSKEYAKSNPEYDKAMGFLVDRINQRLSIFLPDQEQRQALVAQEATKLMYYQPDQLYKLAQVEGYAPSSNGQGQQAAGQRPTPERPKSIAGIPGATGSLPASLESQAKTAISASIKDLDKIPLEDLDKILKNLR